VQSGGRPQLSASGAAGPGPVRAAVGRGRRHEHSACRATRTIAARNRHDGAPEGRIESGRCCGPSPEWRSARRDRRFRLATDGAS
jgi:hypothetical protein